MKPEKFDAVEVWKELEDVLAPRLKLNAIERTVYAHLVRHTRLEGKRRRRFTMAELALKLRISRGPVRNAIRRLAAHGVLRLSERSYNGHLIEVRLPMEVRAAHRKTETGGRTNLQDEPNLEQMDFLTSQAPRDAIHAREGGKCFYCRRRTPRRSLCLDHVVPSRSSGRIRTATWFPAARNATGKRRITRRKISCANCTAMGDCRGRNLAGGLPPCARSRWANCGPSSRTGRMQPLEAAT
jgi:DNA-binding Lrp family transcriptional regulator